MTKTKDKKQDERINWLLKLVINLSSKSRREIADEIWLTEPTFRDFMKWKSTKKTDKLVEIWVHNQVMFMWEIWSDYRTIQDDKE